MRPLCGILVAVCCWPALADGPQSAGRGGVAQEFAADPVTVTTAHPRLLLRPQRLRLLRRERERNSMRWERFAALISGRAPLPERGFALALYYQVSGDAQAGREAVEFALGPDADLRQQALVYDWCQEALGSSQRQALAARLEKAIAAPPADAGVAAARSRALAAIALFDDVADAPQRELDRLVRRWWQGSIVPGLAGGRAAIARDDAYPLFEFLHAMRDSTILDLRDDAPRYFRNFPLAHMVSVLSRAVPGRRRPLLSGRGAPARGARPAPGRPLPRRRTGHGGLRRQLVRQPDAAGLAHAGPLHSAQPLRRAV